MSAQQPRELPLSGQIHTTLRNVGRWIRDRPVSSTIAGLILLAAIVERVLRTTRVGVMWSMGTGYEPVLDEGPSQLLAR